MGKINKKGFMLAEIIIVSVILATALVSLFATFCKIFLEYEKRSVYESVDAIYASRGMAKYYSDLLEFDSPSDQFKKIDNIQFLKKYKVVDSYIIRYTLDSVDSLLSDDTIILNEKYKEYLEYLKNNLDFNDVTCNYIIVTEISDNCDVNKCYEDNGNISFGYYKII